MKNSEMKRAVPMKDLCGTSQIVNSVRKVTSEYGDAYVCCTDNDDFWANTKLRKHIENNPDKPFVCKIASHEASFNKGDKVINYIPVEILV